MKSNNQILKTLRGTYPLFLLLLVLFPLLVGYFVDSDLLDTRLVIINLIWLPLFTIPAFLWKKKYIYQIVNLLYFIIGFIEILHWVILKGPISLTSILVISNTNLEESIDFFDLKATYGLLILIPYLIIYILSVTNVTTLLQVEIKRYVIAFVLLLSVLFIGENIFSGRLIRKGIPQLPKVAFSFIDKIKLYNEAAKEEKPKLVNASAGIRNKNQTVVLILGESCSRNHMSLYGYNRETTPKLASKDDIIIFDNVVSPYSNTMNSILSILSESNLEKHIDIAKRVDIIDVFHSAGFKTYWISNQPPLGIWDNQVTVFANQTDVNKFVNISSNSSFEATLTSSYDAKLFKPFAWALEDSEQKKFIVLHLMGNHSSYVKRYPQLFDVFQGEHSKGKIIAQYDNSILYSDFVVDSLLSILSESTLARNSISSAIYLSDHGENVFDEFDRVGHDYAKNLPKSNVEIPFIVWFSKSYKEEYREKVDQIKKRIHLPFVSDDLFHSILDVSFIESSFLDKKRSIFSNTYNEKRIRVLEDNMDYDKK